MDRARNEEVRRRVVYKGSWRIEWETIEMVWARGENG